MAQATAFTCAGAAVTLEAEAVMQLDLEVLRRNRHEDTFQAAGDPKDADWLQKQLRGWLALNKWHPSRWGEFELVARKAGRWDTFARVRG